MSRLALIPCLLVSLVACTGLEEGLDEPTVTKELEPGPGLCGQGQIIRPSRVVAHPDPDNEFFGAAVATDGKTVVIGSPHEIANTGDRTGMVLVYDEALGEPVELFASDASDSDYFGAAVDVAGDTLVIGSYADGDRGVYTGSIYIFERIDGQWLEQTKILADEISSLNHFGVSLAVSDDASRIVVGTTPIVDQERVYVFAKDEAGTWSQETILTPSSAVGNAGFGASVDIEGTTIVVGAKLESSVAPGAGAVYIFEFDEEYGWEESRKLTAVDAALNDTFGQSLSLSGDILMVGAPLVDADGKADVGAVYVVNRANGLWLQDFKIRPPGKREHDQFGAQLASSGTRMAVRSGGRADLEIPSSAYLYDRCADTSWFVQPLETSGIPMFDKIKRSIALGGDFTIVGSGGNRSVAGDSVRMFGVLDEDKATK